MARLTLIAFLALAFSAVALTAPRDLGGFGDISARANQKYLNCGDPSAILAVNVSSGPVNPGQNLTVAVNAFTRQTLVKGTYAVVSVFLGIDFWWTQNVDVCGRACPISPGPYAFNYTILLPANTPPNELNVFTNGFSSKGQPLFCFTFSPS